MKKERKNLLVLAVLFGCGWLCAAASLLAAIHYKSQNRGLRELTAALERMRAEDRLQTEMLMRREEQESQRANQSLDFLSWKLLLTDELREANARLSSAVARRELRKQKELANLLYYSLGLTCTAGSDFGSARRYFAEALENDPRDTESCYNLGLLYSFSAASGDRARAAGYYRRYLELAPEGKRAGQARARLAETERTR